MRVIAGIARGRRLTAPKGLATRPTSDRVREALFSMLAANLRDARVLDLFAGTGALGIEALSRGAAHATFVEKDRAALGALRQNLRVVANADHRVLARALPGALFALVGEPPFDLVFLDPPYAAGLMAPTLERLANTGLVAKTGIAVCEHDGRLGRHLTSTLPKWDLLEIRAWGDVAVSFLCPKSERPVGQGLLGMDNQGGHKRGTRPDGAGAALTSDNTAWVNSHGHGLP